MYIPAAGGGFVWDDDRYVTNNAALHVPGGLKAIWTDCSVTPQYYPLTHTSFWIEYRIWQLNPRGYHAVNITLHAACSVLLFIILRSLGVRCAWLAAALFGLHPVHVESVAWITERKNVLSGIFYLSSILCWIRYFALDRDGNNGNHAPRSPLILLLAMTFFACGLLSKTVVSTLPVTLFLILWWKRKHLSADHGIVIAAMLVCGALMGYLTSFLEKGQIGAEGAEWSLGSIERIAVAGRAWWFYIGKLLYPASLSFIYPRWEITGQVAVLLTWPAAAAAVLAVAWVLSRRMGRGPATSLAHYTVALAPALGFFNVYPMRYSYVADHFQYLASIGILVPVAAAIVYLLGKLRWKPARLVPVAVILVTLGYMTWERGGIYDSHEALWRDTLKRNPGAWIAHNNLGIMTAEEGKHVESERHLRRALYLKPDHAGAMTNLGLLYLRTGRTAQALEILQAARLEDPENVNAHLALGDALTEAGIASDAEKSYVAALRLDPGNAHAHLGVGISCLGRNRFHEAARHLRLVLIKKPDNAAANHAYGTVMARLGNTREALVHFRACLALDPRNAEAHYNLGTLLAAEGRLPEAERHLAEAVRLRPSFEPARRNLELARTLMQASP